MIPDIITSNPDDVASAIIKIAHEKSEKEKELRKAILESPHIDRLVFSKLEGQEFLLYVLICLAYSKIDTELRHIPIFEEKIKNNISAILSKLSISETKVLPLSSIEEMLYSILK